MENLIKLVLLKSTVLKPISAAFLLAILSTACSNNQKSSTTDSLPDSTIDIVAPDSSLSVAESVDSTNIDNSESQEKELQPLTQYLIISNSSGLRTHNEIAKILKGIGFKTSLKKRPSSMDEMEQFTVLTATRESKSGTTKLTYATGEDTMVTIRFASMDEADAFVESMRKSGYTQSGEYFNPKNGLANGGDNKLRIHVTGKTVKLCDPFEMPPIDF